MQLNQIHTIGLQTLQTSLDALQNRFPRPILAADAARMSALGEKKKFMASFACHLPNEFLALLVTLGRVDHINAGVECALYQTIDQFSAGVADVRAAEAEHGHVHIGLAETPPFHGRISKARFAHCHPWSPFNSRRSSRVGPDGEEWSRASPTSLYAVRTPRTTAAGARSR